MIFSYLPNIQHFVEAVCPVYWLSMFGPGSGISKIISFLPNLITEPHVKN